MAKLTKKQKATAAIVDSHKFYDVDEAVKLLKEAATAKFDETVELAFNLNINPKYADQQLRGATVLPHGTGKSKKVLVFAKDQGRGCQSSRRRLCRRKRTGGQNCPGLDGF